jgi:hypothetical protein
LSYVLVQLGFDYNDETYNHSEGGYPVKTFDTREAADAECLARNIETYKKGGTYGGGLGLYDEDFSHEYMDEREYPNLHHVTKDTPDADIIDLIKKTKLVFFEVIQVPHG